MSDMVTCAACRQKLPSSEATTTSVHGSFHHDCWMQHECSTCGRVCTRKADERLAASESARAAAEERGRMLLHAGDELYLLVNAYLQNLETSDPPNLDDVAIALRDYERASRDIITAPAAAVAEEAAP